MNCVSSIISNASPSGCKDLGIRTFSWWKRLNSSDKYISLDIHNIVNMTDTDNINLV